MKRLYAAVLMLLATFVAGAGVAPEVSAAVPPQCATTSGLTVNRWIGPSGPGQVGQWDQDMNWTLGQPTILSESQLLCVVTQGTVRMSPGAGIEARAGALRLSSGARLEVLLGNKLFVNGPQADVTSILPSGALILVSGATFGGTGAVSLAGTLVWRSVASGAASISSRYCGVDDVPVPPCTVRAAPGGDHGVLRVTKAGIVVIDGGGVNLVDEYTLKVRGRLRTTGDGYVAADHGTHLVLIGNGDLSGGRFELRNDGGWNEGRDPYGLPMSTITNDGGFIYKSGTNGASVLAGQTTGTGTAEVATGTLALNGTRAVHVQPARRYSSGRCDPAVPIDARYACQPVASTADLQIASVLTGSQDPGGARVSLREATREISGFGRTQVVDTAGLSVTRARPAVLSLRYDTVLRAGRLPGAVQILHKHGSGSYTVVPHCRPADGGIPNSAVACVDHRPGRSRILPDGDLLMLVRTIQFSRWVAR